MGLDNRDNVEAWGEPFKTEIHRTGGPSPECHSGVDQLVPGYLPLINDICCFETINTRNKIRVFVFRYRAEGKRISIKFYFWQDFPGFLTAPFRRSPITGSHLVTISGEMERRNRRKTDEILAKVRTGLFAGRAASNGSGAMRCDVILAPINNPQFRNIRRAFSVPSNPLHRGRSFVPAALSSSPTASPR